MKLIPIIILFLGTCLQLFSQTISAGFTLNPSFSNRIVNFSKTNLNENQISSAKKHEILMPFVNTGFFVHKQFDKLGLSLGVNYLHTGFRTKSHVAIDNRIGNASESTTWYRYHFLEFPLSLDFKTELSPKIHLYTTVGISIISGIRYRRYIYSYRGLQFVGGSIRDKPLGEYSKVNIGNHLHFGINVNWSRSLQMRIGPSFKFFYIPFETIGENITYVAMEENTKGYFYHIGLEMRFLYQRPKHKKNKDKNTKRKGIKIFKRK